MTTQPPLVSVIIASYNQDHIIHEAIESVLEQSYPHWELIIIDDGSTDKTTEIIRQYMLRDTRIQLIQTYNHGSGDDTRMIPASFCRGEYVTFLDGDDKLFPDSLQKRVNFLNSNPSLVGVGAGYNYGGNLHPPGESQFTVSYFLHGYLTRAVWAYMYRREVFQTLTFKPFGLYGDAIVTYEIVKHYENRVGFMQDILYDYRYSSKGASFDPKRIDQRVHSTLKTLHYFVNDPVAYPQHWKAIQNYSGHAIQWELDNIRISFSHRQVYGYTRFFKVNYFKKQYFNRHIVWPHAIRNVCQKSALRGRFYKTDSAYIKENVLDAHKGFIKPTAPPKVCSSAVRQGGQRLPLSPSTIKT
jgi:glycosyltransferase involved in cell wall biosynthesis